MAKTDFSNDSTGSYNTLDVILVRTPGFIPWLRRMATLSKWDDVFILLDGRLCQVVKGRFMQGPTVNQWKGLITSGNLECTVINFKSTIGTEAKARSYMGQRFKNTPNCISHIFGLFDSERATINSLLSAKI